MIKKIGIDLMFNSCYIVLIVYLFAFSQANAQNCSKLVFSDDFSNPAITENKFSFYDPNNTYGTITAHTITNNYLELRMDVTDANSWAVVNHNFSYASKIKIVCDLYYQAGSSTNYYMPQINFSEYSNITHKITGAFIQAKMQTDVYSSDNPCGDDFHPSLVFGNSATSTYSCLQGFNKANSFATAPCSTFYNKWINGAIIILDKTSGYVSVDIEGDGLVDMEGYVPANLSSKINTISFSPYGWWTGHLMRIRNLKIYAEIPKTYSTFNQTICEGQSYFGYTANGKYVDTLTNIAGCDSIRTLNLTVFPKTYSSVSQTICEGQSYFGYTASGKYVDTLMNVVGCDSIRTLNLTVIANTHSSLNQTICEGQNYFGYTVSGKYVDTLMNAAGCDSIRTLNLLVIRKTFSFINKIICKGENYLGYAVSGTYSDTLLNRAGCDSIRTLDLTVYPSPVVFAGKDTSLLAGTSLLLSSSKVLGNIVSMLWTPDYNIDDNSVLNPTVKPLNTTIYVLTVIDVDGCAMSDSIKVTVNPVSDVFAPNAFTPNGDGKNDIFKPIFFDKPKKYRFNIYNRFGQVIYETDDYTRGWDGKMKGILLDAGTYVWMMKYTLQNGLEKIKNGTVFLIR